MDRKTKPGPSKLSAFFDDDDEEPPSFPHKVAVDDAKLSQYAAGTHRKSRREKEQEAAEAKKREEEVNAAKAYADFIDAFEGGDVGRKSGSQFVKAESGSKYTPALKGLSDEKSTKFELDSLPAHNAPKPKGKRAMDAFLEEIKKDQADREAKYSRNSQGRSVTALAAYEGQSGSKDRGDPQTSNVFVANLPPNVSEQSLGSFFARAGPVGSVKIMWPRGDGTIGPGADMTASRRSKNSGLSGFVSFMTRRDAEEALREFDGLDWGGSILRVGWSKAVPVAAKPMYGEDNPPSALQQLLKTTQNHQILSPTFEEEAVTDVFIRAVAVEVKGHGRSYEENLLKREATNGKYAFLRKDVRGRRYNFYKNLVEDERSMSPEFDDEGYNSVYSTDSAEESERERVRKTTLGRLARKRFEAMLRALSGKRGEIARCMAFSLEHAEAAHEIADIIVASLLVEGTPVPRKVARLHLICDILHNSAASVPSAWKFRQEFQSRLGIVFDHLSNIYHSFPGRITAETFKKQITTVVDIWEDWIVFPPAFTSELRVRLEGMAMENKTETAETAAMEEVKGDTAKLPSRFTTSTFKTATEPASAVGVDEDLDGAPLDTATEGRVDGTSMDDVDGTPIEDTDGTPMEDLDGAPMEDLDGTPMEDVDGIPMEDVDGAPMDNMSPSLEDLDGEPLV
ncbi:SR140 protein [Lentinula novae-zelandiae]|nr:SR140 protein [Lentinula novae-zelandiae]